MPRTAALLECGVLFLKPLAEFNELALSACVSCLPIEVRRDTEKSPMQHFFAQDLLQ